MKGMPSGYEEMTVAQISEGAKTWNHPMLEAALEYEQAHAARKGALSVGFNIVVNKCCTEKPHGLLGTASMS